MAWSNPTHNFGELILRKLDEMEVYALFRTNRRWRVLVTTHMLTHRDGRRALSRRDPPPALHYTKDIVWDAKLVERACFLAPDQAIAYTLLAWETWLRAKTEMEAYEAFVQERHRILEAARSRAQKYADDIRNRAWGNGRCGARRGHDDEHWTRNLYAKACADHKKLCDPSQLNALRIELKARKQHRINMWSKFAACWWGSSSAMGQAYRAANYEIKRAEALASVDAAYTALAACIRVSEALDVEFADVVERQRRKRLRE